MRDNFESDKEVSFLKLRNMGNIFFFSGGSKFKILLLKVVWNLKSQVSDKFTNQVLVISV